MTFLNGFKRFNFLNNFKRLHKWLALLVGIQLILWIVSGIVFSFINQQNVDGEFIYKNNQTDHIVQAIDFIDLLEHYPTASQIAQINLLGKSVIKLIVDDNVLLLDRKTKKTILIDQNLIKRIASRHYQGGGKLQTINLVSEVNDENRDLSLPTWQVIFDDEFDTHLYFSAKTGEYQGVRTASWRTFDFFMMLHFMDYDFLGMGQRGDFNHLLIIIAAIILVFFSLSGMLLIYSSFSIKDFVGIVNRFYQHKKFRVTLLDKNGVSKKIKVNRDQRLMDALAEQNIELDSVCGGGGICGFCRIKLLDSNSKNGIENLSDHDTLDDNELAQGYRLACQLSVYSNMKIEIDVGLS